MFEQFIKFFKSERYLNLERLKQLKLKEQLKRFSYSPSNIF